MKKLVVIDTETGGLDAHDSSILTLGAVVLTLPGGEMSEPFHMYVQEEKVVASQEALRVNGITMEEIGHGMSPSFVTTAFEDWLHNQGVFGRQTLAGHNIAGFDMSFIKRLYQQAGKKLPFDYHVFDTMSLAVALRFAGKLDVTKVSLDNLCAHFGIKIREQDATGRHNSAEDAVATAKLIVKLLDLLNTPVAA
jgi:DNA polymerase III subunit epsilon